MRFSGIGLVVAAVGFATSALAWPASPLTPQPAVTPVQLQCSPASCIDPRTGVYTQSTCDRYGCRPISGPVGRVGRPDYGYGPPPAPPPYGYGGGYGGGVDCNPSRCIVDGRIWESTCNRRGCRPLRPARGYW